MLRGSADRTAAGTTPHLADAVLGALRAGNIKALFHVPTFAPALTLRARSHNIIPVACHGEQAATWMAGGYSRASGGLGVVGAQAIGRPGVAAGLVDVAAGAGRVMVLCGGERTDASEGLVGYQERNAIPWGDAFHCRVDPHETMTSAWTAALTWLATPGSSAVLEFPGQTGTLTFATEAVALEVPQPSLPPMVVTSTQHYEACIQLAREIAAANHVAVLAGGPAARAAADDLLRLTAVPGVDLVVSVGALTEPRLHEAAVGVAGNYGNPNANAVLAEADVTVVLATSLDTESGAWLSNRNGPTWRVEAFPNTVDRTPEDVTCIVSDVASVVSILCDEMALPPAAYTPPLTEERETQARLSKLTPVDLMTRLAASGVCDDAVVVVDTGQAAMWLAQHYRPSSPGPLQLIRSPGVLGWALPAGIGATFAMPDSRVVVVTGDGGLLPALAELETAVRHGRNLVVVVNDNGGWAQEQVPYTAALKGPIPPEADDLWRFPTLAVPELCRALGAKVSACDTGSQLEAAFADVMRAEQAGPHVVVARTDPAVIAEFATDVLGYR